MKRAGMLLCFAMFLSTGTVRGQQSSSPQGSGGGEQAPGESAGQKSAARAGWHGSGIVADNLDRVGRPRGKIFKVLIAKPGWWGELKTPMAREAEETGRL